MPEEKREDFAKKEAASKETAGVKKIKESANELIKVLKEDLRRPLKEHLKLSQKKKDKRWSFLTLMGLLLGIVGIGTLGYTLWNLMQGPSLVKSPEGPSEASSPSPLETSQELLGAQPIKPVLNRSLVLKNFLVPLQSEGGAPVFIKATVVLYFESQREVLWAQKLENPLRGLIFEVLRSIPFYYWRSKEGISKVRDALLETLKNNGPEGLKPQKVEVIGYILK